MDQHNINQMFQQIDDLKMELVEKNKLYFLALRIVDQVPERKSSLFLSIGHAINIEEFFMMFKFLFK